MGILFDVIVLTWNRYSVTKTFIDSYLQNTSIPSRLIIIDNASTDETSSYLRSLKSTESCQIKVIINNENRGFVEGMNQGISLSTSPYICFANNDLIFTQGWLQEILYVFEKYPKVGLLNPNSNNLGTRPVKREYLQNLASNLRNKYHGIFVEMPFCIGFCMCVKREVIRKVGGFSLEFQPMFFEDTDFSMKVKDAGYLIGMAEAAYVWHEEHVSLEHIEGGIERYFVRNRDIFYNKWGKILRVAFVIDNYERLLLTLTLAIQICREGNYVCFFCNNFYRNKQEIFSEVNMIEHSGIQFCRFKTTVDLVYKILAKKKRFDMIISSMAFINRFFKIMGYNTLKSWDINVIRKLKGGVRFSPREV